MRAIKDTYTAIRIFLTISGILGATVKPVINVMGSLGEANHRKKMQQQFP